MKILVAGDFCPQNRVAEAFEHDDFASVLSEVKETVSGADYSIVNLECPVTKEGEKPISKVGLNLQCSEKGMEAIKWVGFDCVTLANNHFYDYGDEGVTHTLEACDKYGIDSVGGGRNLNEASRILYKQINGQTLAIINCCEHEFSIATEKTGGSNPLNPIQQYYAIREARTQADFVLVIVHGGHEYWQLPSPRMVETYRFFVDAGADAVVNHHQHCFSGYEIYNNKPIFYGLGNFCFDEKNSLGRIWNEGYMVQIDFTKSSIVFVIFIYEQCKDRPAIKKLSLQTFNERLTELNRIIGDEVLLKTETEKFYVQCAEKYSNIFEPIRNRYYLAGKRRGWFPTLISRNRKQQGKNFICCEAHRDCLIWFLNQNKL